ncbi:aftiphilin-like isoform X2 [Rhinoraja longicauda]
MEPDVIRMYSSSPPPLDDGTEFDEDEFGEFGGFSGVGTSTLGYNDFDLEDPHENFMSQNHFVPGHEYSSDPHVFADFHLAGACEGKDILSDFSKPMPNDMARIADKDATQSKSKNVFECTTTESIKQTEVTAQPAILVKNVNVNAVDLKQEEQEECYNGGKTNPEVLTNGYSTMDSEHSQGIENMVATNDQKAIHFSELPSDLKPGLVEDFTAFSNIEMSATLKEEKTDMSLPTIGTVPLITEYNSGNESTLGNLPAVEAGLDLAVSRDEPKVVEEQIKGAFATSECKNEKDANEVDHTQCHPSELSTTDNIDISNGIQSSSESMEYFESRDQNTRRASCESLGTVKETTTTVQSEASPAVQKKHESDLETCNLNEETLEIVTHSIAHNELVAGQDNVVIEELPAAKTERTKENVSDDFRISRRGSVDGEVSVFGSVLNTDVQPGDSDNRSGSNSPAEEFATFQEDDFGDFGTTSNDSASTFANFPQCPTEKKALSAADVGLEEHGAADTFTKADEDFGEFGSTVAKNGSEFTGFHNDEGFSGGGQAEWNAFGESASESTSWAAFGEAQSSECKEEMSECSRTEPALSCNTELTGMVDPASFQPIDEIGRIKSTTSCDVTLTQVHLLNRLGRIFQTCFPSMPVLEINEEVSSLRQVLLTGFGNSEQVKPSNGELLAVWTELQDVEDAHGLRYQWGGSHSNKKLLISLGIDTRNILFTGQRKQPVIVPAYASGLGMLEPTKEPVKPISAAEKIASIGQTPTASVSASEMSTSTCDQTQDHVPPVQFDWSSSGLTNPLDGVDPELYELTTSKLEGTNAVSRMTDAFARLMSTAEKTSTSSRKPKKVEVVSGEAAQVIATLPDLSFMHSKVLMFPTTLRPLVSTCEKAD